MRVILVFCVVLAASAAFAQVPTVTPTPGIVRLELKPLAQTISVGEFANYTATGIYDDESTRNLTQKVEYDSSDPTVAEAPNTDGNKGRVNALKPGVVTISATEPVSGISTTDTGGVSGTLTVQGAVVSITVKPLQKSATVGDVITYTATGLLSDGNTKNMTQKVVYSSSDTSVAVCPNADGNRSQVQAVGVGTTVISVVDPVTEIASDAEGSAMLTVVSNPPSTPTPGPNDTPIATPTPTPPAFTKAERACQTVLAAQGAKFAEFLLRTLQKCLDRTLQEFAAPKNAIRVATACRKSLDPNDPDSVLARVRAKATAQMITKCVGLTPSDLANPCQAVTGTMAGLADCLLARHAANVEAMVSAEYGHACTLLRAVGLGAEYPLVCLGQ